jgi:hypothetical protein
LESEESEEDIIGCGWLYIWGVGGDVVYAPAGAVPQCLRWLAATTTWTAISGSYFKLGFSYGLSYGLSG